ncbi:MAG: rod shape-determining protein MreD [Xanthomonadales bacterium]|nr:rod shape-determining protein MreD [Xanthomonadales bacterium]
MNALREKQNLFYLLLGLGLFLSLLPLPDNLEAFRPPWVSLLLIYMSLQGSRPVSLGFVFSLGLLADILLSSLIGLHALQWVVLMFLMAKFSSRIRFSSPLRQMLTVFFLLLNERFILLWVLLLRGEHGLGFYLWVPAIIGALIWPLMFVFLSRLRQLSQRN